MLESRMFDWHMRMRPVKRLPRMKIIRYLEGFCIIIIALAPLLEVFDHWEQWGRDPEFEFLLVIAASMVGLTFVFKSLISDLLQQVFSASLAFTAQRRIDRFGRDHLHSPSPLLFLILCDLRI